MCDFIEIILSFGEFVFVGLYLNVMFFFKLLDMIGVIAVVLFPLWPYMLKYTVFMISLVLVTAILSIIVLRLIAYLFGAMFGVSFWILPNFFADCTIM